MGRSHVTDDKVMNYGCILRSAMYKYIQKNHGLLQVLDTVGWQGQCGLDAGKIMNSYLVFSQLENVIMLLLATSIEC